MNQSSHIIRLPKVNITLYSLNNFHLRNLGVISWWSLIFRGLDICLRKYGLGNLCVYGRNGVKDLMRPSCFGGGSGLVGSEYYD